MSTIPPITGIPVIGYPDFTPYTQITPFTVRDGATYLLTLEALKDWIRDVLVPQIDTQIAGLGDAWSADITNVVNQTNQIVTDLTNAVNTAIAGITDQVAQANAAVTAAQAAQTAAESAETQAGIYAGSAVAFQDSAMADLVNNVSSALRVALNALYGDAAVASLANNPSSLLAGVLNNAYAAHSVQDTVTTGRLTPGGLAEVQALTGQIPRKSMDTPPLWSFTKGTALSVATIAAGGSGYAVNDVITLAGGTAVIPAQVKVTSVSSGAVTAVSVQVAGLYTANPTSPTAQASTTGTGTGATFNGTWTGNPSGFVAGSFTSVAANDTTKIRFSGNGPTNIGGSGGYGSTTGNSTATVWEWETDAPVLEIRFIAFTTLAQLYVNGQRVDPVGQSTDASAANVLYRLDFGTGLTMRSYKLVTVNSAFIGVRYVTATNATFRLPSRTRKFVWGLGDSYMYGNGASDASQSAFNIMLESLGLDGLADGVGGAGWTGSTSGDPATRINAKLVPLTRTVDYIVLDLGYNNSGSTTTDITNGVNAAITAAQTAKPGVPIIVFGPATPLGETAQLATVKTTMQSACAAFTGVTFIDVANWVNTSNSAQYTGPDSIHPTPVGHAFIGARKAAAVRQALGI